jgi:predicted ABC-type exoprotein transport system permease subunit
MDPILILIIVLILVFGFGGYNSWFNARPMWIILIVLLIVLLVTRVRM